MPSRLRVPVWLMGLTNLPYVLYGGVVAFAVPQLLGDRQVPEGVIAGLTAVAVSPGFWAFLFSPILMSDSADGSTQLRWPSSPRSHL